MKTLNKKKIQSIYWVCQKVPLKKVTNFFNNYKLLSHTIWHTNLPIIFM